MDNCINHYITIDTKYKHLFVRIRIFSKNIDQYEKKGVYSTTFSWYKKVKENIKNKGPTFWNEKNAFYNSTVMFSKLAKTTNTPTYKHPTPFNFAVGSMMIL